MKKALLYGLSVTMLLASLTACNKPQADQPTEPDPTPTPSAVQTQPAETPTPVPTVEPTNKVGEVQPMSANEVRELTQDELIKEFEESYKMGETFIDLGLSDEDILGMELGELNARISSIPSIKKPADLDDQYITWREANHPKVSEVTQTSSSNPQTRPVQQTQGGGTQQTAPVVDQQGGSIVNPGGTGSDFYNSHQGKDPSGGNPVFKPMDNPWDTEYTIDYGD